MVATIGVSLRRPSRATRAKPSSAASGQSAPVQDQQPCPSALGLSLIVHLAVRRTPAVLGRIDFDLRGTMRGVKSLAQRVLCRGLILIVVLRDGDEETRARLRDQ